MRSAAAHTLSQLLQIWEWSRSVTNAIEFVIALTGKGYKVGQSGVDECDDKHDDNGK